MQRNALDVSRGVQNGVAREGGVCQGQQTVLRNLDVEGLTVGEPTCGETGTAETFDIARQEAVNSIVQIEMGIEEGGMSTDLERHHTVVMIRDAPAYR